jgi:hypothetical protein
VWRMSFRRAKRKAQQLHYLIGDPQLADEIL